MGTKGLPYDCNSIMHYPNDAFAAYGKKTITSKNPNTCQTFTTRQYYSIRHEDQVMTANDIATIRNVYCETPVTTTRKPVVTTRQPSDCPYSDKESMQVLGDTRLLPREQQVQPLHDGQLHGLLPLRQVPSQGQADRLLQLQDPTLHQRKMGLLDDEKLPSHL